MSTQAAAATSSASTSTLAPAAAPAPAQAAPPAPTTAATPAAPPATETVKTKEPGTSDLRSGFAALSREEARIQKDKSDWKAQKERESSELARYREIKEALDKDPYAALDKFGIDVHEWARRKVNGGKETAEQRLERLEKENENGKRLTKEREEKEASAKQAAAEAAAREGMIDEITQLVQNGGEKYEFIKSKGASEVVFETMDEHYRQTGRVMEYDEACDLVEKHFEEEATKLMGLSKVKAKLVTQVTVPGSGDPKQHPGGAKANQPQTLTQSMASTAPDRVPENLTREELDKRFRARLRGS